MFFYCARWWVLIHTRIYFWIFFFWVNHVDIAWEQRVDLCLGYYNTLKVSQILHVDKWIIIFFFFLFWELGESKRKSRLLSVWLGKNIYNIIHTWLLQMTSSLKISFFLNLLYTHIFFCMVCIFFFECSTTIIQKNSRLILEWNI